MGKKTEMSRKFRKRSVPVQTDGRIKIGDEVVYNTKNDSNYRGDQVYIKAVVKEINRLNWATCNAYEYKLDFGGLEFWTNYNKVRKLRPGEDVSSYSYGKYKVGQRVYCLNNHLEMTVSKVKIGYDGSIEYVLSSLDGHMGTIVGERLIRARKNNITDGRFKVGDFVTYRGVFNREQKSVVSEAYTFDDEKDIYFKLNGYYNGVINDHPGWIISRPPKIIFSVVDPYGEEDWDEE